MIKVSYFNADDGVGSSSGGLAPTFEDVPIENYVQPPVIPNLVKCITSEDGMVVHLEYDIEVNAGEATSTDYSVEQDGEAIDIAHIEASGRVISLHLRDRLEEDSEPEMIATETSEDGKRVILEYNEPVQIGDATPEDYRLVQDGEEHEVTALQASDNFVILDLEEALDPEEAETK